MINQHKEEKIKMQCEHYNAALRKLESFFLIAKKAINTLYSAVTVFHPAAGWLMEDSAT